MVVLMKGQLTDLSVYYCYTGLGITYRAMVFVPVPNVSKLSTVSSFSYFELKTQSGHYMYWSEKTQGSSTCKH